MQALPAGKRRGRKAWAFMLISVRSSNVRGRPDKAILKDAQEERE